MRKRVGNSFEFTWQAPFRQNINEPVQLYVSGNSQPYEIVVNQVNKDRIVGYLATPKVKLARR